MRQSNNIKRRAVLVSLVFFGVAFATIFKAGYTQLFESEKWQTDKYKITREVSVNAPRGNIYSDDLSLIATSMPEYELRWDSKVIDEKLFNDSVSRLSYLLSQLFNDKSQSEYESFLRNSKSENKRYVLIKRKVNYNTLKKVKQFPIFRLNTLKGGFISVQKNRRQKPFQDLADRTIGYDRIESKSVGLEGAFNLELKGKDGRRLEQRLAGKVWKPIWEIEPIPGKDIVTTINIKYQDVATSSLKNQLTYHDAELGCAILMEVKTGAIKAIVNLKKLENGGFEESYNYAIAESSEPGSTFKLASVIVGLEDGFLMIEDSVSTNNGEHVFYNQIMRDSKKGGYGKVSLAEAFQKSSNVGISKLIFQHYKDKTSSFVDRLYSMDLNEPLGISISGERTPNIRHPKKDRWSGTTLPWMSIGYGVEMTPLQILSFYATVANDGKRMRPFFVQSILDNGIKEKQYSPIVLNPSICSQKTIDIVKNMMLNVVEKGTAKNIKTNQYKIAGKTGTAQLIIDGAYSNERHNSSFVGYFPADKPTYACIVSIKDPKQNGFYGGDVAGPVFKKIADYVFANDLRLNEGTLAQNEVATPISMNGYQSDLSLVFESLDVQIENDNQSANWVLTQSKNTSVDLKNRNILKDLKNNMMPSLKGMAISDVLFLLENHGLKVEFEGRGEVKDQSIAKGNRFVKGQKIKLKLS